MATPSDVREDARRSDSHDADPIASLASPCCDWKRHREMEA
jgi:hypothetical protein